MSSNPTQDWFDANPDELPYEVEEEAEMFGMDIHDQTQRRAIREMLMMDDDMFGDWDRFQ